MFSRFFIQRPIFAAVLSILIVVAGAISLLGMPIAQYPQLSPPTVSVSAMYPGANAQVLEESVARPIEQEVNGVEGMLYMSSNCSATGQYQLTVTFAPGVDLDQAAVKVQNRVASASAKLPQEVTRNGVKTQKRATDFAVMVALSASNPRFDDVYLSNLATLQLKDRLTRISGVGDVSIFGAEEYAMRVWLDPELMRARGLTTLEVLTVIREQNAVVAAGVLGQEPAPAGQAFETSVTTRGRLSEPEEFERLILKTGESGRATLLGDVARIELGTRSYSSSSQLNGLPAATVIVYQQPGANLLNVVDEVRATVAEIAAGFPEGVDYTIGFDASEVVEASIYEIIETLLVATLLVILTVLLFLQDWRATLIPSLTIPVSLIGAFSVLAALGFSLNTVTMFGIVLAIGIVVDDAIVVVENVSRHINENGLTPKDAAIRTMGEVTGPIVATTLVLVAVFLPTAFLGGVTGVIYNQFGLTIATATVFSSINALTLSPALCGVLMRPRKGRPNALYRGFNWLLERCTNGYLKLANPFVRRGFVSVIAFLAVTFGAGYLLKTTPQGFFPDEDQGYLMINVQLPDGASAQRTAEVIEQINTILAQTPGVAQNISLGGMSLLSGSFSSNSAAHIAVLDPWEERKDPSLSVGALSRRLSGRFAAIQEAIVIAFPAPSVPGFGNVAGFDLQLQDRSGLGLNALEQATAELSLQGNIQAATTNVYSLFRANVPQYFLEIDRQKVKRLGIDLDAVAATLQAYLGSAFVNEFSAFGRNYQVVAQADAGFRADPDDIRALTVRNRSGDMVPLGTLLDVERSFGPSVLRRYNLFPTAQVLGQASPGFSSGQANAAMAALAEATLPEGMGFEWSGLSFQEENASGTAGLIFALALLLVYLVLAAQYESWRLPAAILLAVPLGILGAMALTRAMSLDNNVYTQVGLVMLVAMVSKNAILIVEFAKALRDEGHSAVDAALESVKLRFRPILMTALSFLLGVLPLVLASGAGSAARQALGVAVFGGMLLATLLGILMTPGFYTLLDRGRDPTGAGPS